MQTMLAHIVICGEAVWLAIPGTAPRLLTANEWGAVFERALDRATYYLRLPVPKLTEENLLHLLSPATVYCARSLAGHKCCPTCRTRLGLAGLGVASVEELTRSAKR